MNQEKKQLVRELKKENEQRSIELQGKNLNEYSRTCKTYYYNNTLDIIKRMEAIIGEVPR